MTRNTVAAILLLLISLMIAGCHPIPPSAAVSGAHPPSCIAGMLTAEVCTCMNISEGELGIKCCGTDTQGIQVPILVQTEDRVELAVWQSTADYSQPGEAFCIDLEDIPVSTEKIELVINGGWAEETDGAFGEPCTGAVRTIEMQSLPHDVSCSQGSEACLGIDDIGLLCNQSVFLCLSDYQYASSVCGVTGDQMCRTGFRSVLESCSDNVEIEFGK